MSAAEQDGTSVPVQLTRMEGKFDLVLQRLDDLIPRVTKVEGKVVELESTTQRLDLEAKARDEKAIALALALKDAKETQEAEQHQSWSPVQRFTVVAAGLLGIVQIYQTVIPNLGG